MAGMIIKQGGSKTILIRYIRNSANIDIMMSNDIDTGISVDYNEGYYIINGFTPHTNCYYVRPFMEFYKVNESLAHHIPAELLDAHLLSINDQFILNVCEPEDN